MRLFRRRAVARACLVSVLGALAACGSGDGFPGGAAGGPLEATFASIQANVFTPICEQCHSGATAPFGLRLDAASSYALLVGVRSGQDPGFFRVQPHDPSNSYLIRKLEGTAGRGERMPAGLPPLPQAEIDVIRQWISDGALLDAPPMQGPVRLSSLDPEPDSVLPSLPSSITAIFDRELNASTVTTATFMLERSGGDGTFADGNEVAIAPAGVAVPLANPRSAVMDLTGVAAVEDTYRVTLVGTGSATILDLDGNALDGERGSAFPSGDGAAGGNFQAPFRVEGIQPTLQSVQTHVFTPICAGCHTGPAGGPLPGGMDLTSAGASFANLVSVASVQAPTVQRVAPGNPDGSYLIRKLEGAPTIVGGRMPLGGPPLPQATIEVIRQWISNGAAMP